MQQIAPERLVFLDESGFSLCLYRHYGWSPCNQRCVAAVPFVRGTNLSVLGAYSLSGMQAITSKAGAFKRDDFEQFLQESLLPVLPPGSVLVLDNARIHHGGQVAALVEQAGCSLLYLPPYSPDFSPIELAWGWVKHKVRAVGPRDEATRQQAVHDAVNALPPEFASAWFRKCGYLQS
jgi:transposase